MTEREWWNAWSFTWWKIGKHAEVELSPAVRCKVCDCQYHAWDAEHTQGHDICAWSVLKDGRWIIHCGYGSDFDLHEFWYIDNYPSEPQDGICDWCIRRMLRDGTIIDSGKELTIDYTEVPNVSE